MGGGRINYLWEGLLKSWVGTCTVMKILTCDHVSKETVNEDHMEILKRGKNLFIFASFYIYIYFSFFFALLFIVSTIVLSLLSFRLLKSLDTFRSPCEKIE